MNTAAPDPSADSMHALIAAAERHAESYDGDDRPNIKTDVLNAFYAGSKFSSPAAAVGGDRAERMFAYVTDMATRHGWIKADGEGALEFLFRKHYAQGRDDTPAAPVGGFVVDGDYVLPCDVQVWPATTITKGCKLSTLIRCIQLRDGPDLLANADYEQLGELLKPHSPPPSRRLRTG